MLPSEFQMPFIYFNNIPKYFFCLCHICSQLLCQFEQYWIGSIMHVETPSPIPEGGIFEVSNGFKLLNFYCFLF